MKHVEKIKVINIDRQSIYILGICHLQIIQCLNSSYHTSSVEENGDKVERFQLNYYFNFEFGHGSVNIIVFNHYTINNNEILFKIKFYDIWKIKTGITSSYGRKAVNKFNLEIQFLDVSKFFINFRELEEKFKEMNKALKLIPKQTDSSYLKVAVEFSVAYSDVIRSINGTMVQ